ncbi:hypothetical protein [Oceanithermus sp.]|uniref:hypothetical protein n=1 Tax=Oceanithermus sp. TaxID=2268145 RepID=UPI0025EA322C|nr:hypothetical protein [Oceanithermus sp.]
MKRTQQFSLLLVAALLGIFAALALGSSYETRPGDPSLGVPAAVVLLYDADGRVIWSSTFPGEPPSDVLARTARVELRDAQDRVIETAPVEPSGYGSAYPVVHINGRPVAVKDLLRSSYGYGGYDDDGRYYGDGSYDGSYRDDDGYGSSSYDHDDDRYDDHDGSYDHHDHDDDHHDASGDDDRYHDDD